MDRILWLTADEIIHLTDRVRNEDRGTEDMQVCAYPLLLKLGSLFIEAVGSGKKLDGTLPIAVSEAECWLLRSKVTSMDKSSSDAMFGVKLCTKLYQALEARGFRPQPHAPTSHQWMIDLWLNFQRG